MTVVLEIKIKKKDLPSWCLDILGLPEMGNHDAELIFLASVSAIFGVCLPHRESRISCAALS